MNIRLGQEFEYRINEKIKSGLYTSASEVIRDGLRLLFDKDLVREREAELLKEELSKGLVQFEPDENNSISDILQEALKIYQNENL
jgi:antitoxin ParD1/3/4